MYKIFCAYIFFGILISCNKNTISDNFVNNVKDILKPKGLYSSSFGNESALDHSQVIGSLIRVKWKDIEPSKGVYNFSIIEQYLQTIKSKGKKWSLGIIAGGDSPSWLIDELNVDYFEIVDSENNHNKIPKIWDPIVNEQLSLLAKELAINYNTDNDLMLVYVPQMTSNGIEGHFNGVSTEQLISVGFTSNRWVNAVKETATLFAKEFTNKAIAVELHEILNDSTIPTKIMNDLWDDTNLNHRVGVAMWWLSGKISYQPNLIAALEIFPGDIYAQAIGKSDQVERFDNDDYTTMFKQAKAIGIRYIELWEYEFVNNTFPEAFQDFNNYSNNNFD